MDDIGRIGDPVELPFIGLACPEEVRQFSKWELGRFLRLQKIGSGFASTVYLCMDTFTNRRLALKVRCVGNRNAGHSDRNEDNMRYLAPIG